MDEHGHINIAYHVHLPKQTKVTWYYIYRYENATRKMECFIYKSELVNA